MMTEIAYRAKKRAFVRTLIAWGRRNRREFPWRHETDAFRILIAEVLLQRSRAKTVAKIYQQLFERWPDSHALAEAPLSEVEEAIRPLGLVRRATKLKALANALDKQGSVPDSVEGLMQLPGVGRYIASATVNTTLGKRESMVDGVTARVYSRFFGVRSYPPSSSDKQLWKLAAEVAPKQRAYELNWAVLDLAASICMPKIPKCEACPLQRWCAQKSR